MQKQTLINKKNALAEKKAVLEAKKRANQERIAQIRTQKNQVKQVETNTQQPIKKENTIQKEDAKHREATTITSTPSTQMSIAGVDIARVRMTWL